EAAFGQSERRVRSGTISFSHGLYFQSAAGRSSPLLEMRTLLRAIINIDARPAEFASDHKGRKEGIPLDAIASGIDSPVIQIFNIRLGPAAARPDRRPGTGRPAMKWTLVFGVFRPAPGCTTALSATEASPIQDMPG
ncbi:MAG: hypothetical protein Q7U92_16890, partial [Bradyrhizobium sp.]|nr:hypothetical protein [Bradyrhizobium sp.]